MVFAMIRTPVLDCALESEQGQKDFCIASDGPELHRMMRVFSVEAHCNRLHSKKVEKKSSPHGRRHCNPWPDEGDRDYQDEQADDDSDGDYFPPIHIHILSALMIRSVLSVFRIS